MINYLHVEINNVKNIKKVNLDIPYVPGIYVIAGTNGCGKSTIMNALAQTIMNSLQLLEKTDYDNSSNVKLSLNGTSDEWVPQDNVKYNWGTKNKRPANLKRIMSGFYEGSIFYGTRFNEWQRTTNLQQQTGFENQLVDASDFVVEKLSYILHGNKDHYKNLKRLRSINVAEQKGFKGMPYFYSTERGIISQYQMSSGECMLISLLHFVFTAFVNKRGKQNDKQIENYLILIDEVELALHPSAVHRLYKFAQDELCDLYKAIVIFSTHSQEVIRRVSPNNLFYLENKEGVIEVTNPCYPNYAIRELYTNFGHDFVLLVEDNLSKKLVERIFIEEKLYKSKLYFVLPIGGWQKVMDTYLDMVRRDLVGFSTKLICIIDGDVEDRVKKLIEKKKDYENIPILFLPIPSVEKYLHKRIIVDKDSEFKKEFGDKYLRVKSLSNIINDFRTKYNNNEDESLNKKFYDEILLEITSNGVKEEAFLENLAEDIYRIVDFNKFRENLKKKIPF